MCVVAFIHHFLVSERTFICPLSPLSSRSISSRSFLFLRLFLHRYIIYLSFAALRRDRDTYVQVVSDCPDPSKDVKALLVLKIVRLLCPSCAVAITIAAVAVAAAAAAASAAYAALLIANSRWCWHRRGRHWHVPCNPSGKVVDADVIKR